MFVSAFALVNQALGLNLFGLRLLVANQIRRVTGMIRETVSREFSVIVNAKQNSDGLWVADIRIAPEPSPEIRRAPNQDLAFGSRAEAEAHGMKIADELIYKMKAKAGQGIG